MIDHIDLPVRDFPTAQAFYRAALAPLGFTEGFVVTPTAGCLMAPMPNGGQAPVLWLHQDPDARGDAHVAFLTFDRATVDAFHAAALAAGAKDIAAPAEHPEYHPGYYAAYVHDPDGSNIEVVCHA